MNNHDFNLLVSQVNMLIGHCQSAEYITKDGIDLEKWKTRLMELGEQLRKAWDEAIVINEQGGE